MVHLAFDKHHDTRALAAVPTFISPCACICVVHGGFLLVHIHSHHFSVNCYAFINNKHAHAHAHAH